MDHGAAQVVQARLVAERWQTYTSNFVLAETHGLLLRRANRALALAVIQRIIRGTISIERISPAEEQQAVEIIARYDDKDFSYTDTTSFAVMERLGIDTAFTFDRHFAQYGFRTLAADQT